MGDYEFIVVKNILEDFVTYNDSIDTSSITKYYLDMILGFQNHALTFHLNQFRVPRFLEFCILYLSRRLL